MTLIGRALLTANVKKAACQSQVSGINSHKADTCRKTFDCSRPWHVGPCVMKAMPSIGQFSFAHGTLINDVHAAIQNHSPYNFLQFLFIYNSLFYFFWLRLTRLFQ